jgi:hypothetical protein
MEFSVIPVFARIICRCVPSPQSNSISSPSLFTAIAEGFRFGVGVEPPVPKNVIRSIHKQSFLLKRKLYQRNY